MDRCRNQDSTLNPAIEARQGRSPIEGWPGLAPHSATDGYLIKVTPRAAGVCFDVGRMDGPQTTLAAILGQGAGRR